MEHYIFLGTIGCLWAATDCALKIFDPEIPKWFIVLYIPSTFFFGRSAYKLALYWWSIQTTVVF